MIRHALPQVRRGDDVDDGSVLSPSGSKSLVRYSVVLCYLGQVLVHLREEVLGGEEGGDTRRMQLLKRRARSRIPPSRDKPTEVSEHAVRIHDEDEPLERAKQVTEFGSISEPFAERSEVVGTGVEKLLAGGRGHASVLHRRSVAASADDESGVLGWSVAFPRRASSTSRDTRAC